MECELVEIRTHGGQGGGSLIVGRIRLLHLEGSVLDPEGKVLPEALAAVGRMGGDDWVRTRERFPMPRPE